MSVIFFDKYELFTLWYFSACLWTEEKQEAPLNLPVTLTLSLRRGVVGAAFDRVRFCGAFLFL